MANIIKQHNSNITQMKSTPEKECDCRDKQQCPLGNQCLTPNIVYKAEVITNNQVSSNTYIGISGPPFKQRYRNHMKSFNNQSYKKDPELSKHVWDLKNKNINYNIKWSILKKTNGYNRITKSCSLCLYEKMFIYEFENTSKLINKKSELVSKCRHQNRYILKNFIPNG